MLERVFNTILTSIVLCFLVIGCGTRKSIIAPEQNSDYLVFEGLIVEDPNSSKECKEAYEKIKINTRLYMESVTDKEFLFKEEYICRQSADEYQLILFYEVYEKNSPDSIAQSNIIAHLNFNLNILHWHMQR